MSNKLMDAFVRLLVDDTQLKPAAIKAGTQAGQAAGQAASKGIGNSLKQGLQNGIGLGVGLGGVQVVERAVQAVTQVVKDSITAFNEDQVSQSKLATSLKANIPNWDGNTDAIEKAAKAGQDLGFQDDDTRLAVAALAAATHDQTKALDLLGLAYDLARFKNESLATATDELVKVQAGSFRSVKSLGIELQKGATSADAFAAIQRTVTRSAADYAQTNEGKVLVSQAKVNEAMEKLGSVLAGPVADATVAAADGITKVVQSLDDLNKRTADGKATAPLSTLSDIIKDIGNDGNPLYDATTGVGQFDQAITNGLSDFLDFITPWDTYVSSAQERKNAFDAHIESIRELNRGLYLTGPISGDATAALNGVDGGLTTITDDAAKAGAKLATMAADVGSLSSRLGRLRDSAKTALQPVLDKLYGPAILKGQHAGILEDINSTKDAIDKAKKSGDKLEVEKLRGQLAQERSDLAQNTADQALLGQKPAEDTMTAWLKSKLGQTQELDAAVLAVIADYKDLATVSNAPHAPAGAHNHAPTGSANSASSTPPGHQVPRATGGDLQADTPYWVGEQGPEPFFPGKSGKMLSNWLARRSGLPVPGSSLGTLGGLAVGAVGGPQSGGRASGDTLTINVDGLLPVRTMADIRREHQHAETARQVRLAGPSGS